MCTLNSAASEQSLVTGCFEHGGEPLEFHQKQEIS
jgi:hypothetical protein